MPDTCRITHELTFKCDVCSQVESTVLARHLTMGDVITETWLPSNWSYVCTKGEALPKRMIFVCPKHYITVDGASDPECVCDKEQWLAKEIEKQQEYVKNRQ